MQAKQKPQEEKESSTQELFNTLKIVKRNKKLIITGK